MVGRYKGQCTEYVTGSHRVYAPAIVLRRLSPLLFGILQHDTIAGAKEIGFSAMTMDILIEYAKCQAFSWTIDRLHTNNWVWIKSLAELYVLGGMFFLDKLKSDVLSVAAEFLSTTFTTELDFPDLASVVNFIYDKTAPPVSQPTMTRNLLTMECNARTLALSFSRICW